MRKRNYFGWALAAVLFFATVCLPAPAYAAQLSASLSVSGSVPFLGGNSPVIVKAEGVPFAFGTDITLSADQNPAYTLTPSDRLPDAIYFEVPGNFPAGSYTFICTSDSSADSYTGSIALQGIADVLSLDTVTMQRADPDDPASRRYVFTVDLFNNDDLTVIDADAAGLTVSLGTSTPLVGADNTTRCSAPLKSAPSPRWRCEI